MNLYIISFKRIYKNFYVEATSFSEAEEKLFSHLKLNESENYKVNEDGSVEDIKNKEEKRISYIEEISVVSREIIK